MVAYLVMERFSQAAENNKTPILDALRSVLANHSRVLEVGSGSGQHAFHFAANLPQVTWQPSDRGDYLNALVRNIAELAPANVLPPIELDLERGFNPAAAGTEPFDCVYAANVIHIARQELGEVLIKGAGECLARGGLLLLYGPFKYGGEFTTPSNADFDVWLKDRDPDSGVRDIEWASGIAANAGLVLLQDRPMPANNQLLIFGKG